MKLTCSAILTVLLLSSCFPENSNVARSDTSESGNYVNRDQVSTKNEIKAPPSPEEVKWIELKKNKKYNDILLKYPIYSSEIRSKLIRFPDRYRQSYRPVLDNFRGLDHEFRCIHSKKLIGRVQNDGWELVKCDEKRAVFFKENQEKGVQCEALPSLPELYETLTLYPLDSKRPNVALDLEKERKRLRGGARRPTNSEVSFSHPLVSKFLGRISSGHDKIIPEIFSERKDEVYFFDPHNLQVVNFYNNKSAVKCRKNPLGRRYARNGWIELDATRHSFFEMADELKKYIVYVR